MCFSMLYTGIVSLSSKYNGFSVFVSFQQKAVALFISDVTLKKVFQIMAQRYGIALAFFMDMFQYACANV